MTDLRALVRCFLELSLHCRYRVLVSAGLAKRGDPVPYAGDPVWKNAFAKAKGNEEILGLLEVGIRKQLTDLGWTDTLNLLNNNNNADVVTTGKAKKVIMIDTEMSVETFRSRVKDALLTYNTKLEGRKSKCMLYVQRAIIEMVEDGATNFQLSCTVESTGRTAGNDAYTAEEMCEAVRTLGYGSRVVTESKSRFGDYESIVEVNLSDNSPLDSYIEKT